MRRSARSVTPFNRALQDGGAVQHMLGPGDAAWRGDARSVINQQAQIIAYVDDYKMMIFTTLPSLLLLLLMRRPRRDAGGAGRDPRGDGVAATGGRCVGRTVTAGAVWA